MKRERIGRRGLFRATFAVSALSLAPSSMDTVSASSIQAVGSAAHARAKVRELQPYSDLEHQAFMHGVASGDPLPSSVILWTRVTPTRESVPGSGMGPDVRVRWEIAADDAFVNILRSGEVTATARTDHTVHVDPHELAPSTQYFFRFQVLDGDLAGAYSPVGTTRTAPADNADIEEVRLAVCSCANYESGYFSAYTGIAEAAQSGEIDVVVHMGDYLYEYASGEYTGKKGVQRAHVPTWTLTELADYRARYGNYRRDPELQAAHAAVPWVVTWDDHEIANNAHAQGAEAHETLFHGDYQVRRDAAMQAYLEWLPVRGHSPTRGGHIYRTLRFGQLAELHMLDLRSYRSQPTLFRAAGRESSMMGSEQFEWLERTLSSSQAQWNLIGTSVMMAPLNLVSVASVAHSSIAAITGAADAATAEGEKAVAANPDQWDGYAADRARLLRGLAEHHPDGRTVFLTGDIHSEWANDIHHNGRVVAAEMISSSISAPNVDDMLLLPADNSVSQAAETHIRANNPHVRHVELDAHGFAVLSVRREAVTMTWYRVDDLYERGSAVRPAVSALYDGAGIRPNA